MAESSYKKFSQLLLLLLRDMEGMIVISCKVIALQFSEIQNNYFCWTSRKLLIMCFDHVFVGLHESFWSCTDYGAVSSNADSIMTVIMTVIPFVMSFPPTEF